MSPIGPMKKTHLTAFSGLVLAPTSLEHACVAVSPSALHLGLFDRPLARGYFKKLL